MTIKPLNVATISSVRAGDQMRRLRTCLSVALFMLMACDGGDESEAREAPSSWAGVCVDADRDGFGFQCKKGEDCDDTDPGLTTNCGCEVAAANCPCPADAAPLSCVVEQRPTETGTLLCKTGIRYCRDGAWSECIGATSFEVPPPKESLGKVTQGLIDQNAAPRVCGPCYPYCYMVEDLLETIPADAGIAPGSQGGLTITSSAVNPSAGDPDAIDPSPPCTPGVVVPQFGQFDNDCDGIPDNYDSVVGLPGTSPPFVTSHKAITMDLAPGQAGSQTFQLQFLLKTVDVYFLLDTTASMNGELERLIADLTAGNFLDDPSTMENESTIINCASPLGSTTSDASLKAKGIAGNIACLVPGSGFGAGHFREIPFDNPDTSTTRNFAHAFDWFVPYEHRQNISTSVSDTLNALKLFYTAGNQSWPEADTVALYAVATGSQGYMGWNRPGISAKTCANTSEYFGYPCFRRGSIPVVVLITDASMMNGPDVDIYNNGVINSCITQTSPFTVTTRACTTDAVCEIAYPGLGYFCDYRAGSMGQLTGVCIRQNPVTGACAADGLPDGKNDNDYRQPNNYVPMQTNTMSQTPDATYHPVSGNENFLTAKNVGTINDKFITYAGDTRGMVADVHLGNLGATCS